MRSRKVILYALAGILVATVLYTRILRPQPVVAQRSQSDRFDTDDYRPKKVVKAFPAIIDPPSFSVNVANKRLGPNELVLGVEIDGVARAYPINMLTGPTREIFNDQLGEHRIAATW